MKLKYLLPVATIASVAAIVTPLVTSCGEKWDAEYDLNINKSEFPGTLETEQYVGDEPTDLTAFYFDNLNQNHQIMFDDTAFGLNYSLWEEDYQKFEMKISVNNINTEKQTLDAHVFYEIDEESGFSETNEYTFTNMKMVVQKFASTGNILSFIPAFLVTDSAEKRIELVTENKSTIKGKTVETDYDGQDVSTFVYGLSYKDASEDNMSLWTRMYSHAAIPSWYLYKLN